MARATSPADLMSGNSLCQEIPQPAFKVGDRVTLSRGRDRKYNEGQYVRHLIRHWRRASKCRRGRLSAGCKDLVRQAYQVLHNADTCEIAGVLAQYGHNRDYPLASACYVGGVPGAASGMTYAYQLLIRWTDAMGRPMALFTGIALVWANELSLVQGAP